MIGLIAETSNTLDVPAVVAIVTAVVGGGSGYLAGKAKRLHVANDPLNVNKVVQYATKEDLRRLEKDIDQIKFIHRDSETKAHQRMDEHAKILHGVDAKSDMIIELLKNK